MTAFGWPAKIMDPTCGIKIISLYSIQLFMFMGEDEETINNIPWMQCG
jgi:hypothetical protein